jgi:hypothetical protein
VGKRRAAAIAAGPAASQRRCPASVPLGQLVGSGVSFTSRPFHHCHYRPRICRHGRRLCPAIDEISLKGRKPAITLRLYQTAGQERTAPHSRLPTAPVSDHGWRASASLLLGILRRLNHMVAFHMELSGDVRKSSLDDTRKGPPDDVAGVKDGRHGDNFSFL